MERFKKILKKALQAKSERLELADQTAPLPDEAAVDQAYICTLTAALFPKGDQEALQKNQRSKAILQVPGFGKIMVYAPQGNGGPLTFFLPPNGEAEFQKVWDAPPVVVAPQAPAPMLETTRTQSKKPEPIPFSPQPMAGEIEARPVAPAASKEAIPALAEPIPFMNLQAKKDSQEIEQRAAKEKELKSKEAIPFLSALAAVIPKALQPDAPSTAPENSFARGEIPRPAPQPEVVVSSGPAAIDDLLRVMVQKRASDLHLTCGEPVCLRVDGDIVRIDKSPISTKTMESFYLPIIPRDNLEEFNTTHDTDFAYEVRELGRFRVNLFRDRQGVGMVLRHIPSKILTAQDLKLPKAITQFCNLTKGLVLVTGPTGSGKSTTLAAMIDQINRTRQEHIITIEDPIEFVHPQQRCLINQREVSKHTKSFARALKAALREDPDIVLIGEMRDLETVAIAIETAETGHLVFGTLHTTSAVSTVDRIVDQFPTDRQAQIRVMLASSLKGVVSQTLLKKKGGGRVAAHEILVVTDTVSALVREGKNHMIQNHMTTQKADGNELLNNCLIDLVKNDLVTPEEAYMKAVAKRELLPQMKQKGIDTTAIEQLISLKAS